MGCREKSSKTLLGARRHGQDLGNLPKYLGTKVIPSAVRNAEMLCPGKLEPYLGHAPFPTQDQR